MLRSMTGYGRAEKAINEKVVLVELRSLNGKQFELLLKLPVQLKPFEFEIRNMLSEQLVRGSIECTIIIKQNGATRPTSVNLDLAASYYNQIKGLAESLEADDSQLLASILRMPEVVSTSTETTSDEEWVAYKSTIEDAIAMINKHRTDEGLALENRENRPY
ncbi:MAG: hypothetical protein LW815_08255 [Chitinophagaceae bacterium]|nr:hypothetical protein [Chitinophagaceae bacterium]